MTTIRNAFHSAIAITAVLLTTVSVRAEQADKYTKPHEPFTAPGMQVRMSLVNPINRSQNDVRPTVFQEIAPCRLSSTLTADHYELPWGGTAYAANEARRYPSRGVLATQTFLNPCSDSVPSTAIGIVARFTVTPVGGDGEVHIDAFHPESTTANTVLKFTNGQTMMFESGIMLNPDGSFGVETGNAGADVTIDLLGYLLPDPSPAGPRGDTGATGAMGPKGDAGDKGDKGDTGATGATGAKGEKGDTGDTGAIGPKGDTGDKGDKGPAGANGDKGDTGAVGPKGDKGDTGAVGPKGDKGNDGAAGSQGPMGPMGPQGPAGPEGPQGPTGPASLTAVKGKACYPPGNNANAQVTVSNGAVHADSIVILNYTDAGSNGNALAIISQSEGSFHTTGSPNRCFQYVVFNAAP